MLVSARKRALSTPSVTRCCALEEDLRKAERIRLQLDAELDSNSLKKDALIAQQDSLAKAYEAKWSEPLNIEPEASDEDSEEKDVSEELRQTL